MNAKVNLEVDERTADALEARAAERGVSVSELLTDLVAFDSDPIVVESDQIAELDRRWNAIQGGQPTVPHDRVVRWLRTWGTPAFRSWRD